MLIPLGNVSLSTSVLALDCKCIACVGTVLVSISYMPCVKRRRILRCFVFVPALEKGQNVDIKFDRSTLQLL